MDRNCKKCYLRQDQYVNDDELMLLTQYIPFNVVKLIGESECCVFDKKIIEFQGTVVYFDIIGFTPIVVNYFNQKRDIADLSNTLSEYYSVIIETIRGFNGSIYQFAGDSILISFEKAENETLEQNFKRAFTAMNRALELSDNYNSVSKDTNGFTLKPKIGMGCGSYSQILLGHKDLFITPVLVGNAIKKAIDCEKQCSKQELIIDSNTFEYAKKSGLDKFFEAKNSYYYFTQVDDYFRDNIEYPDYYDAEQLFEKPFFYNRMSSFLNPIIKYQIENRFQGFSGEYKDVTCIMVKFDGIFAHQLENQVTEEYLQPLNYIYTNVNRLACKYGGYCMKPDLSDKGIVFPIVFGIPSALENKESNAILCCTEILKASKENEKIDSVNIGVVTGMVYSGEFGGILRKDYTIIGNSINLAARLMAYNIGKEKYSILMDEKTKDSVKGYYETEEIKNITCKGYDTEQTAYKFKNVIDKNNFFNNSKKLFGRIDELKQIESAFEKIWKNKLSCIAVTGDAGIGKTFFVDYFLSLKKEKDSSIQIYSTTCYQYEQTTPFYCWKNILKQLLQISDDLPENIAEILVKSFFAEHFPEDEMWVSSLLNVMGYNFAESHDITDMDLQTKQKNIFAIIYKIISLFGKNPLVVVFENIQWSDVISFQLLEYIINKNEEMKTLFVLVSRDSEITKQFFENNKIENIKLNSLTEKDSTLLANFLLNMEEPNISLCNKIVYSSDGNPFFIENIIHSLIEKKLILDCDDGHRCLSKNITNIDNIEIPSSIQNIILSRLDSLKFEEQIICKTASAIGRSFYTDCLREILPERISDSMIDTALEDFETHNIITKEEDKSKEYMFNHVITHDVIYETILDTTKKELNLMVLTYLEAKNKGNLYPILEKLEYHAIEAKNYQKIFIYAKASAEKAEKQAAPLDSISHYKIARKAWNNRDDDRDLNEIYSLEIHLAEQYRIIGEYKLAEELFECSIKECKDTFIYTDSLRGLGRCYQERGDFDSAVKTLELALSTLGKKVPKHALSVYLSIVKEIFIQIVNFGLLKGKIKQYVGNKNVKKQTECDILCLLNKLYYFGLPEKIAWSSLANFNISLHFADKNGHLCLACGDYAVSLSSVGFKRLGVNIFEKGFKLSQNEENQKVESIFKSRYAYYFLFYNDPQKSISLLEEACAYFTKISEQWELMTATGALAQNYFLIGEFEKSLDAYNKTGILAKKLHSSMHLGWEYNKAPFIQYITGKISADEAIVQLIRGIELSSLVKDNMTLCIHYGHLAYINTKEKHFEEALDYAKKAMYENDIYKINVPHIKISYVNIVEAVFYAYINNKISTEKKSNYIKMAIKAEKSVFDIAKTHQMLLGPSFRAKSMINYILGNKIKARENYNESISILKDSPYKWEYENTVAYGNISELCEE
ncbi:MAG: AAA family ATPase [Treponema sp.]|nr:AAA family ATPase [Treponema sp.]